MVEIGGWLDVGWMLSSIQPLRTVASIFVTSNGRKGAQAQRLFLM